MLAATIVHDAGAGGDQPKGGIKLIAKVCLHHAPAILYPSKLSRSAASVSDTHLTGHKTLQTSRCASKARLWGVRLLHVHSACAQVHVPVQVRDGQGNCGNPTVRCLLQQACVPQHAEQAIKQQATSSCTCNHSFAACTATAACPSAQSKQIYRNAQIQPMIFHAGYTTYRVPPTGFIAPTTPSACRTLDLHRILACIVAQPAVLRAHLLAADAARHRAHLQAVHGSIWHDQQCHQLGSKGCQLKI